MKLTFLKALFKKKKQVVLTVLSIAMGILTVVITGIVSTTGKTLINNELDSLGMNGISVTATVGNTLKNDTLEEIKKLSYVKQATPVIVSGGYLKNEGSGTNAIAFWGIDSSAEQVISIKLIKGNNISDKNVKNNDYVCLINENMEDKYFNGDAINKNLEVLISNETVAFKVVGVVETDSCILQNTVGEIIPNVLYIPYTSLQTAIGINTINQIAVNVNSVNDAQIDEYTSKIVNEVNASSGGSIVKAQNLSKQRNGLSNTLNIISAVLGTIGLITLCISGFSSMTVMMFLVNERTKEIGIKKTLGASFKNILFEFLGESVLLSLMGCFLAFTVVGLILLFLNIFLHLTFSLNAELFITASLISVISGVVFGIYPAITAAKLNPADSLRKE